MASHEFHNKPQISNLDEALERIRQLEILLGSRWLAPRALRLTKAEEGILGALLKRQNTLDKESLYVLMYGDRLDAPDIKILDVLVCKLRRKLWVYEIQIETIWGRGFFMNPVEKAKVSALYSVHEQA